MERKERTEKIKEIELEYSKIYDDLISCDEISVYKKSLLMSKTLLITKKYYNIINQILDENTKEKKRIKKRIISMLLLVIIELVCIFTFPLVMLIPFILRLCILVSTNKLEKQTMSKKELDMLCKQANDIGIIIENIGTFLEVKSNKRIERLQNERIYNMEEVLNINLASSYLEMYLTYEIDLRNGTGISSRTEEVLIKMLQEELGVEECDIVKLLMMAKEKANSEILEEEMKLTRSKS